MPYGDIGFQKVCCIGMPKDMGMNMFFKPQSFQCALQNSLNAAVADMVFRTVGILSVIMAQGRENPCGIAMGLIVPS